MTIEEIKKMDKRLQQIKDPLGDGFPICKKLFKDWAKKYGLSVYRLGYQYSVWKWNQTRF